MTTGPAVTSGGGLMMAAVLIGLFTGCHPTEQQVREEAATIGPLRSTFLALKAYHDACGWYPTRLSELVERRPSCAPALPEGLPLEELRKLSAGDTAFGYKWEYGLCMHGSLYGPCDAYELEATYAGAEVPSWGRAWRTFRMGASGLLSVRKGPLGGAEESIW